MPHDTDPVDLGGLLDRVVEGRALTVDEAEACFSSFMSGAASDVQMAALLMGLQTKGVEESEIAGGVKALRGAMIPVPCVDPAKLVDTAGTGGGSVTTFNISTAAAFVVAGAGVPVAKHGNRSFTSRSGSADVLEALGVRIDLTPDEMARVLADVGIVFMFAPLLHPAMRHVGPVRRALGITTIMNVLGPLTNPARARRQVVGVADPTLLKPIASALRELGHIHALVVHGEPGLDEVSPCGPTHVAELRDGVIREYEISPESLGFVPVDPASLAGGEPAENAAVIEAVLAGEPGPARTAVTLNAAAALMVAGAAAAWEDGVVLAEATLDSGAAATSLNRLRRATS